MLDDIGAFAGSVSYEETRALSEVFCETVLVDDCRSGFGNLSVDRRFLGTALSGRGSILSDRGRTWSGRGSALSDRGSTLVPWDPENDETNENEGAYVAFKINITTADGAVVFPKTAGEYDWVAMPIDTDWDRGFKYVYNFDFTDGAGYIDPEKEVDPENPDDPNGPGGEVLGGAIEFKHTMYGWSSTYEDITF